MAAGFPLRKSRVCIHCKKRKLLVKFGKRAAGFRTVCKECLVIQAKGRPRKKYSREEERARELRKYGLTLADYKRMLAKQHRCCAICGQHSKALFHPLGVDHNHKTGAVRALLCGACNSGLGMFRDAVPLLKKATRYLETHNAR